jgi:porin
MRGKNERHTASSGLACLALVLAAAPARAETGSVWSQPSLFDTPGGLKQGFREAGINLDVWLTNFGQGIISGDGEPGIQWGNKGDLLARFDGEKLGLWQGLTVSFHQEIVWGDDANFQGDGSVIPLNTAIGFPRLGGANHDTSISVTQAFGPRASLSVGKFNMLDAASKTPIMGGGGLNTFMNIAFAAPISGVTPPYIVGAIASYKTEPAIFTLMVYDPRNAQDIDVVTNPFEEGVTTSLSVTFPVKPGGLMGFYSLRGVYSTKDGLDLADVPQLILPPEAQDIETKDGYWFASASVQQYLWQDAENPAEGWGLFAQAAISDGNPNPINWSVLGGIGGTGSLIEGRDLDSWGIGYFYYGWSDNLKDGLEELGSGLEDEHGVEAFYNLALTPWLRLTADLQWIDPATPGREDALIGSLRTQIKF